MKKILITLLIFFGSVLYAQEPQEKYGKLFFDNKMEFTVYIEFVKAEDILDPETIDWDWVGKGIIVAKDTMSIKAKTGKYYFYMEYKDYFENKFYKLDTLRLEENEREVIEIFLNKTLI